MTQRTPPPLPSVVLPEELSRALEAIQLILFGATTTDVIQCGHGINCNTIGITPRSFHNADYADWYYVFGLCQQCQDMMQMTASRSGCDEGS